MSESDPFLSPETWKGVSAEAQAEFLRHGEEMVRGTLALGHGADLRATTAMGIFGAIGTALFAAAATLFVAPNPSWPLIWGALAPTLILFTAAGFCGYAARPQDFYISGFEPRNLLDSSAKDDGARARVLMSVTQDRIDRNRRALDKAADFVSRAFRLAAISPVIAAIVFLGVFLVFGHAETANPPASAAVHSPAVVAPAGSAVRRP